MLTLQARQVASDYGVPSEVFSASWSWRKRFLRHHQMSLRRRTRVGRRTPMDAQQLAIAFGATVRDAVAANKCVAVFNADQTALNYKYLPTHTINGKGERTVWIRSSGVEKSRMTVMLLTDAEGKKRAPFAVLKQKPSTVPLMQAANVESQHGFGRGVWAEASRLVKETGIQICDNNKGWWNASLSALFLRFDFGSRDNIDNNILLLWDDFSGHWTEEVRAYAASINVVLLKIPPGYTAVCQPVDVAWMKPLKLQLRGEWVADMEKQLHEHRRTTSTGAFKMIAPKRATVISWLDRCWQALPTETIRSGFKNLLLSSHEDVCSGVPVSGCGVFDLVSSLSALNVYHDMGSDIECD